MGIIAESEEKVQRNILKSCKSRIIAVRVCVRARPFLPELIVTLEKCSDHDNHDMCVHVCVCVYVDRIIITIINGTDRVYEGALLLTNRAR